MNFNEMKDILDTPLPPTEKSILVVLSLRSNDKRECWPAWERIKKDTGLSRTSIYNGLKKLEKMGAINRERQSVGTLYRVQEVAQWVQEAAQRVHVADSTKVHVAAQEVQEVNGKVHVADSKVQEVNPNYKELQGTTINSKAENDLFGGEQQQVENPSAKKKQSARITPKQFQEKWNSLPSPFPQCIEMSNARKASLRARSSSQTWRDNWERVIDSLPSSPFHRGANDRGWVANPDWMLRADSVLKFLEKNGAPKKPSKHYFN